ncbi:MAG TPA: isochorismate synthase [Anaerolineales bacterium]|nr:isochorismate synthase [Anaerolineales bacterium]
MSVERDLAASTASVGRLLSVTVPAPGLTANDFLAAQTGARFYWNRDDLVLAGGGIAAELVVWDRDRFAVVRERAAALFAEAVIETPTPEAGPRLFGGFAFQNDFAPDNTWAIYAPALFILPHFQFTQIGAQAWLTINAQQAEGDELSPETLRDVATERLASLAGAATPPTLTPLDVRYPMTPGAWEGMITAATTQIRSGALAKVVLARACEINFREHIDARAALAYLDQHYVGCYRFLFEPQPHRAWFGATPELLARVAGHDLETMALAGSIRRGASPEQDSELGAQILADPKERSEHEFVVAALRERLAGLCTGVDIPATPDVLRLSNIQHLHTPARGRLREPAGVLPVIERLHPTPAMGGSPTAAALDFIRASEPIPRGWYASPIGWLDARLDGEFAVGIRSAVADERRVWLYAGAGIVGDSQPDKEWRETALKFMPMLRALGAAEVVERGSEEWRVEGERQREVPDLRRP